MLQSYRVFLLAFIIMASILISSFVFAEPNKYPVKMKDDLNHEVVITREPLRIISLAPSITETLFSLGLGMRIVGVTTFCNFPEVAKKIPKIGGHSNPSLEMIVALEPDLVIATEGTPITVIEQLKKLGIPLFALNPRSIDEIIKSIKKIGMITGFLENADKKYRDLNSMKVSIINKTKNIKFRKKVLWLYSVDPYISANSNTFAGDILRLVGAINITGRAITNYPKLNIEFVVVENPDIIILASSMGDSYNFSIDKIKKQKGWEEVSAIKNNKIFIIDSDIVSRPGPRVIQALEEVSKIIYPEVY